MKRFLLLWFGGALLIALVLGSFNLPLLYPLVHKGLPTCGTIIRIDAQNHNSVYYSYEVNGKTYEGVQQGGVDGEGTGFSPYCPGWVVYYLPESPERSCIGYPGPMLSNEIIPIILAMLTFPSFILLVWRWRYLSFRKWLTPESQKNRENHSVPYT